MKITSGLSLGHKLSITISLIVFFVALSISLFILRQEWITLEDELKHRGINIAQNLSYLSTYPLLHEDIWTLYRLTSDLIKDNPATHPGGLQENVVVYAMILKRDGTLLAHSNPLKFEIGKPLPRTAINENAIKSDKPLIQTIKNLDEIEIYDITVPIILDKQKIGIARVGVSEKVLVRTIAGVRKKVFAITSALVLAGIAMGFLIARRITGSLEKLRVAARAVGQGELEKTIPVEKIRGAEIKELAGTFNLMIKRIKEKIEEIHKTKEELREERDKLDKILDNMGAGLFVIDKNRRIIWANSIIEGWFGNINPLSYTFCYQKINNSVVCNDCEMPYVIGGGSVKHYIKVRRTRDGVDRYFQIHLAPIRDEKGDIIQMLELSQDITEKVKLEKRLVHSEKLASIGEMAAGVAHEIRNPLGSIITALTLLHSPSHSVGSETDKDRLLDVIKKETKRLNAMLTDFLNFAKPKEPALSPNNINDIIEDTLNILKHSNLLHPISPPLIKGGAGGVVIKKELQTNMIKIPLDYDQIKQVIWNITLNAVQAMNGNGELRIVSKHINGQREGTVQVSISDNGCGIPQDKLNKIFEPFYTTKEGGTGLGLSIANRIVERHGGHIEIESKNGYETAFIINLPVGAVS
ncbi:MAG: HAMP domain-containing protein [Nitrospinae bacterium]|nr:HAMP domain-containing protein [Nitrospinota bacterium]MBI3815042.1 HAMP domain-containing protein [Nitrospinota bacterium]